MVQSIYQILYLVNLKNIKINKNLKIDNLKNNKFCKTQKQFQEKSIKLEKKFNFLIMYKILFGHCFQLICSFNSLKMITSNNI